MRPTVPLIAFLANNRYVSRSIYVGYGHKPKHGSVLPQDEVRIPKTRSKV